MIGRLDVVGLGPGDPAWLTPEARATLDAAHDLVGYAPYLARAEARPDQIVHAGDNREEGARADHAFALAASGRRVCVVSGGDPGVFAMAAACVEALERGPPAWRALDFRVSPGVPAMLAAAARLGAPLGGDFCAISLSDNLKPWALVARRLEAACDGDFALALHNPASRARPDRIADAFAILRARKAATVPVAFARAVGRPDERLTVTTLANADPTLADMATLVLVGASNSRIVERPGLSPLVLTPRSHGGRP